MDLEATAMLNQGRIIACRRCGMGFLVTPTDLDSMRRWGARVVVPLLCLRCFRQQGPLPKERGTVKWFDPRRRYGFIVDEHDDEVYFRQDQLFGKKRDLALEGQAARFHVHKTVKGLEALNVELLD
jgi:cold shock CspA family protein